jgi:hypothetical protein
MKIISLNLQSAYGHGDPVHNHMGVPFHSGDPGLATIIPLFVHPRILQPDLDAAEGREKEQCEAVIASGWDAFLEVGQALATIRNKRLYRGHYLTFEDYCRRKWEFSKSHANRLIEAAAVASFLSPIGIKPTSESQLRPLAGLPLPQIPDAWKRAEDLAGGRKVTAKIVRQAVEEFKPGSARPGSALEKSAESKRDLAIGLLAVAESAARANDAKKVLRLLARLRRLLSSM